MKVKIMDYSRQPEWLKKHITIGSVYKVHDDTYKCAGEKYYQIYDDAGDSHQVYQKDCEVVEDDYEELVEWSGEGFLSVGDIVRHIETGNSVEIACHFHGSIVYWDFNIGGFHSGVAKDFEPIISEKQKEIKQLSKHLDNFQEMLYKEVLEETLAEYLYNQGYRKSK